MASERRIRRIKRLLDEAEAAGSHFDWESVCEAAQAVLAIDPDTCDVPDLMNGTERALSGSATSPVGQPATSTPATTATSISNYLTSIANGLYQERNLR